MGPLTFFAALRYAGAVRATMLRAKVVGLTMVTRNVDDFRCRGVPILNPFKDPPERF